MHGRRTGLPAKKRQFLCVCHPIPLYSPTRQEGRCPAPGLAFCAGFLKTGALHSTSGASRLVANTGQNTRKHKRDAVRILGKIKYPVCRRPKVKLRRQLLFKTIIVGCRFHSRHSHCGGIPANADIQSFGRRLLCADCHGVTLSRRLRRGRSPQLRVSPCPPFRQRRKTGRHALCPGRLRGKSLSRTGGANPGAGPS